VECNVLYTSPRQRLQFLPGRHYGCGRRCHASRQGHA
jgi:hypothetical protein